MLFFSIPNFTTVYIYSNISQSFPTYAEWPLCVKTEQVYMENAGSGVSGAKRKREDNDDDGSIVVLYPGSKEEACTYGDLSKLRRLPFSNYKANEVQNSGTFVSKLIMKPKCNHEDTESVDSSA